MASSGYFENNFQTGYSVRVEWSILSQSVTENTSSLHVTAFLVSHGSSYKIISSNSKEMTMAIDGITYTGKIPDASLSGGQKRAIMSQTVTIKHNTDGSRTVAIRFGVRLNATLSGTEFKWVYAPASGSVTATLDNVPRASKPTLSASSVEMGKTLTISISRAASSFTHRLLYGWYGDTFVQIATGVGTSYTWTVPLAFANNIPDATSGWGTIRCETYNGNTKIGTADVTFTATVPASVRPTCSIQVLDATDIKDRYGNLVQSLSKLYVKTTATPSYGSPITAYRVTANGAQYTEAEIETEVIKAAGTTTVSAYVTDKRGRTSPTASASFDVLPYSPPKITALNVYRSDANGVEDSNGEYIRVIFDAVVSPLNNKNTAKYTFGYKKSTDSEYETVHIPQYDNEYDLRGAGTIPADSNASYDVFITVEDNHGSDTRSTSASTAFTLMNWSADGTGMGVGKVSEEPNTLEVALDNHFYGVTQQEGNRYAFSSPGVDGSAGYVLMAQVQTTEVDADTPITFVFSRRLESTPMTVYLSLRNPTVTSSSLASIRYEGSNYGAFAYSPSPLVWNIYVYKNSSYDTVTLQDWYTSTAMHSRIKVTFPGGFVSQLPTPYYRATPAPLQSILDYVYPVGSIYLSYSHVNPGTLFGGTWQRIESAFLWACTADGEIGFRGGEYNHTLTVNELPAHSHGSVYSQHATGTKSQAWYTTAGSNLAYGTVLTGGSQPHNNMPPYIQISAWRRTA